MKNIKSLSKKIGSSIKNKSLYLGVLISTILITSNCYSKNKFTNHKTALKSIEINNLDTIKKRKTISLKQQNNNERLIVKLNELEKLAEFPGGMEKFYKKVSENLDAS
ncbi:hypothetical protein, partial [Flavobacterium sp.]|uniref:hypothetical protein n=1 Tax=Flavobacterium sp. TaxID=239 RepID=UPI0038FCE0D5